MTIRDRLRPRSVVASVTPRPLPRVHGRSSVPNGPNTVTAAAVQLVKGATPNPNRSRLPWQERAFLYYDVLGEIWYASQFYARSLSRLELRVMQWGGDADEEPIEVTAATPDGAAILEQLARLKDPGGGRSGILGTYGRLMFLTGEALLFCSRQAGEEAWEMLSVDELRWDAQAGKYIRWRAPNTTPEEFQEAPSIDESGKAPTWANDDRTAMAFRLWRRHPRYSSQADGPMKGVLDLCEELVLLSREVRGQARSRSKGNGILFVPDEVSFAPLNAEAGDEESQEDPFIRDLTRTMTTAITDEGSAAAVVPLVLRVAAEYIEKFRHLPLNDPNQDAQNEQKRIECIKRIALGLDMPPEILLGVTDANHWSAWQIDEQSWKAHLEPIAVQLCEDLTASYFRPTLRALGVNDPESYFITFDASAVIVHPDRGRDAKDLHDRLVISDAALREAAGFDDEDAIDDDAELLRRIGLKVNDGQLAVDGVPTGSTPPADDAGAPPSGEDPGAVQPGTPNPDDGGPEDDDGADEAPPYAVLAAAAGDLLVERCRELAGSRLRSKLQGDRDALALIREVPNHLVAVNLGQHRLAEHEPRLLVTGATACFRGRLAAWGLTPDAVDEFCNQVEEFAAATLLDADPQWPSASPV